MIPIERNQANDRARTYFSQYEFMLQSSYHEDVANAELMLIASGAWQRLEEDMIEDRGRVLAGGYGGPAPYTVAGDLVQAQSRGIPTEAFDLSKYPLMIRDRWTRFCVSYEMEPTTAVARLAPAELVQADCARFEPQQSPEPRILDQELQPLVRRHADESLVIDMCRLLRIEVPPRTGSGESEETDEPQDMIPPGLVRATPEEVAAAKATPVKDWNQRPVRAGS